MRVLLTGAAGSIGRVLTTGLVQCGHDVVGLDVLPALEGHHGPWHVADCTDPDAVAAVFDAERLDAVAHFAGVPGERGVVESLTSHTVTTAALLDAMLAHDVSRMVYASSNHAVGRTPRAELATDLLSIEVPPRPDTYYGVAKVAAEALLRLYADRYGLDAVACRIGSFSERPENVRALATWLSPDDCIRMVDAALTAPAPGFAVLYGISANTRAWWDLEPGYRLGYHPADDAEVFAADVPAAKSDAQDATHVGGPFAAPRFGRPAFDR